VTVTNKTGHRFPSGVGFRRALIEFDVIDSSSIDPVTGKPKILWSSGATNSEGFILDKDGNILETEYIGTSRNKKGPAQPHFWGKDHPISSSKQVQIYEELIKDSDGNLTTSFIRRDAIVKSVGGAMLTASVDPRIHVALLAERMAPQIAVREILPLALELLGMLSCLRPIRG